jgi:sulfite reductase (NADPH) flavoprotein alpha-component
VSEAGQRLRKSIERYGQMTLEARYLAKGFLGTHQIESNSRLCLASAGTGYKLSLGADGPTGSYDDLDRAELSLVVGGTWPTVIRSCSCACWTGSDQTRLIVVAPRRPGLGDHRPADVDRTLRDVAATHGGLDPDAYVKQLIAEEGYLRGVY